MAIFQSSIGYPFDRPLPCPYPNPSDRSVKSPTARSKADHTKAHDFTSRTVSHGYFPRQATRRKRQVLQNILICLGDLEDYQILENQYSSFAPPDDSIKGEAVRESAVGHISSSPSDSSYNELSFSRMRNDAFIRSFFNNKPLPTEDSWAEHVFFCNCFAEPCKCGIFGIYEITALCRSRTSISHTAEKIRASFMRTEIHLAVYLNTLRTAHSDFSFARYLARSQLSSYQKRIYDHFKEILSDIFDCSLEELDIFDAGSIGYKYRVTRILSAFDHAHILFTEAIFGEGKSLQEMTERVIETLSKGMGIRVQSENEIRSTKSENKLCCTPSYSAAPSRNLQTGKSAQRVPRRITGCQRDPLSPSHNDGFVSTTDMVEDALDMTSNQALRAPTFDFEGISSWKEGPGKSKEWRSVSSIDLMNRYQRLYCKARNREEQAFCSTVLKPNPLDLEQHYLLAAKSTTIPKAMLQRHERKRPQTVFTVLGRGPSQFERYLEFGREASMQDRTQSVARRGRDRRRQIEDAISMDPFLQHSLEFDVFEDWNARSDCSKTTGNSLPRAHGVTYKIETTERNTRSALGMLSMPYKSHMSAIVGGRFLSCGVLIARDCYDVYRAEDLDTAEKYIAKAYSIHGAKGKERESRVKSLKRTAAKTTCFANVDQNWKKWLFFPACSHQEFECEIVLGPASWSREQDYQRQFPSLDPEHTSTPFRQKPLMKSYADCFGKHRTTSEHNITDKNRRARDRQRGKRKAKRAVKAAAQESPMERRSSNGKA